LLCTPHVFNLFIRARARSSPSTAGRPPIFNLWFENWREQALHAGESEMRSFFPLLLFP
jgi:hypothetical protein